MAPASSEGMLSIFLVRHVGVSTLSDEARAGMCASCCVNMPFSSTLAAAASATERLRGCTVAQKTAQLVFSILAHRGVGRRCLALALGHELKLVI